MPFVSSALVGLLGASCLYATAVQASVVRGVNLGGWLLTEPWIVPSLFDSTNTNSEWALCDALGKDACLTALESHWDTFYTYDDFVNIKNAGLRSCVAATMPRQSSPANDCKASVRIPIGYWSVNLEDYEPFVTGQFTYLIRAIEWVIELGGMTVLVDLHGSPGSENGWEESGRVGTLEFPANLTNADRALDVLTNFTTEFTKDIYKGVVTNIEAMNEPIFNGTYLKEYYTRAANVIGVANSSGINITFHDAFYDPPTWADYNPWDADATSPAEFMTLDTHQFWGFAPLDAYNESQVLTSVCAFGATIKALDTGIPPTIVGEWSLDTGVTANSTSVTANDPTKRTWFRKLFEAQNAAFTPNGAGQPSIGWYFWAWKTEYLIDSWSMEKGIEQDYIPSNVSDPSLYIFPVLETGCINTSYPYEAAASVSGTTDTAVSTSSSSSSSASSTSTSSSTASSKTASTAPVVGLNSLLALCAGAIVLVFATVL